MRASVVFFVTLSASMVVPSATAFAAGPSPKVLAAWNAYVAATEARMESELNSLLVPANGGRFLASDFTGNREVTRSAIGAGDIPIRSQTTVDQSGQVMSVPGATVAHWRGSVLLRGVALDALLHRLQNPDEDGPYPQDVLSLRVLDRGPDRLSLAMRLTRSKIVTATYDTEHVATYRRFGRARAASSSVSTKIVEIAGAGTSAERVVADGEDRGFLWRMNSYWRYEQVADGVIVELESITLSRGIPMGLGLLVEPMIDRIARESVTRTLASVRRLYGIAGLAGARRAQ
jgi:hypothetical protein